MKKLTALLLACALAFSLAACAGAGQGANVSSQNSAPSAAQEAAGASSQPVESAGTAEGTGTEGQSNILVAYFSWANNAILAEDVDAVASPSVITPGNVQQLAEWVQQETGADLFSIRVAEPYPSDWDDCLARANQERSDNARPELVENVENLSQYDTIFLGYPNWWYGVPMALLTFLESNDFSGKQVYLFCSHGAGGWPHRRAGGRCPRGYSPLHRLHPLRVRGPLRAARRCAAHSRPNSACGYAGVCHAAVLLWHVRPAENAVGPILCVQQLHPARAQKGRPACRGLEQRQLDV